jgi:hypothetical protein
VADPQAARVLKFPDLAPAKRRQLLGPEAGTQYDSTDRMFAYWGDGSVLDYGEYTARDLETMLVRDGQAAAIEAVITLPIRQASRAIEKSKGDSGEADFCRSVLMEPHTGGGMKTPLQDVIGQLTSAQTFKKAFFEKVWGIRDSDGKIVYEKLAFRPASTCEQKRNARTAAAEGFVQRNWMFGAGASGITQKKTKYPGYTEIPQIRSWVYINGKHRKPLTGTGELDLCYWAYSTKLKLIFLWLQFLEQQSLPKVIMYGQSAREANAHADDLASMRASGVMGMERPPQGAKSYDLVESSGKGADQFSAALSFLETWQVSSVLAGFTGLASLASLGRGSLALSQDQSAFFLKSRQAVTAEMETAITHDVIAPLVTLNFGPGAAYPSFKFGALTDESDTALVTLFQAMSVAPSLQVPAGILDIITTRLATYLDLDVSAVEQIIQQGAKDRAAQAQANPPPGMPPQAAAQMGSLAGGVDAADKIAKAALKQSDQAPLPEDMNAPFSDPNFGTSTKA